MRPTIASRHLGRGSPRARLRVIDGGEDLSPREASTMATSVGASLDGGGEDVEGGHAQARPAGSQGQALPC